MSIHGILQDAALRHGSFAVFLLVISFVVGKGNAYSEFTTDCTTPPDQTSYVSSPSRRGTLSILWSCLFTTIACTWTIQHLNVPEQRNDRDPGWKGDLKWGCKSFWRTTKWMMTTIIVPEYILGKAFGELCAALDSRHLMKDFARDDGVEWGLVHAFFANMGGFILRRKLYVTPVTEAMTLRPLELALKPIGLATGQCEAGRRTHQISNEEAASNSSSAPMKVVISPCEEGLQELKVPGAEIGLSPNSSSKNRNMEVMSFGRGEHRKLARLFDVETSLPPKSAPENPRKHTEPFHLIASEIFWLRENQILKQLPKITAADINDKSKGDMFIKLITISQVFWFVLNVIVRASKGLHIAQLEIAVTAFAVCAIITYLLILQKPRNVDIPIPLKGLRNDVPVQQLKRLQERVMQSYFHALFSPKASIVNSVDIQGAPIPNDAFVEVDKWIVFLHVGVATGGVIFGSIHVSAWNFTFPTEIEGTLWKAASVMTTVLPPVLYSVLLFNEVANSYQNPQDKLLDNGKFKLLAKLWHILFGLLYLISRLFLLVEVFRTLFFLPSTAYVTTWASNIPHVS